VARLHRNHYRREKPWKAEVKHNYRARFLGYFHTKEEAEAAERQKRLELTGREDTIPGWIKGRRHVAS
jgi:hypothetical protein